MRWLRLAYLSSLETNELLTRKCVSFGCHVGRLIRAFDVTSSKTGWLMNLTDEFSPQNTLAGVFQNRSVNTPARVFCKMKIHLSAANSSAWQTHKGFWCDKLKNRVTDEFDRWILLRRILHWECFKPLKIHQSAENSSAWQTHKGFWCDKLKNRVTDEFDWWILSAEHSRWSVSGGNDI